MDYLFLEVSLFYYLLPTLAFIGLIVLGSANIRLNFFTKAYSSLKTAEKTIALTFDDGPSAAYTPGVLQLLEQYQAKATFFCIGKHIKEHPDLTKTILEKGHLLGNHSYSHSNFFSFFGKKKVIREIKKTNQLLLEATGAGCNLFRPPYGVTNPPIAQAVKACQMQTIGWNIRSFDTSTKDPGKVINRVISKIKPGAVVLLHDNRPNTTQILEAILLYIQENNYRCVPIPHAIK